jgi:cell wall-associated NlpC family hydrolase
LVAALSALAAAATVCATPGSAAPGPGNPPRTDAHRVDPKLSHRIDAVNAELDRLARQSDQLDEQYNQAVAALAAARRTAHQAQQAARAAAANNQAAHVQFLQAVTQQYESGPNPAIGDLLASGAPQQYLDGLTMDSYLSGQFAATVRSMRALQADAASARSRADAALGTARSKETALAARRTALRNQSHRFQQLLDTLTARQRREIAHARAVAAAQARAALAAQQASTPTTPGAAPVRFAGPVSGAVQRVIAFAEAQVGKAYAYGASGPDAFDCSGLTMAAWAQAGVQLPHSAAEQYNYGTHVSYSQLQPGDLIFLYSPIGHVELYVGNDLAVSAADPAIGIVYVHPSQDMADYVGATRLTG